MQKRGREAWAKWRGLVAEQARSGHLCAAVLRLEEAAGPGREGTVRGRASTHGQRGVDLSVIALWLGHESSETTQLYLHADMRLKGIALAHATEGGA
jgi:integrase